MEKYWEQPAIFFVIGGNIIPYAHKLQKYVAANTVPVTVVPLTIIQEPVFLARMLKQQVRDLRTSTSEFILMLLASSQMTKKYCWQIC